MVFPDFSEFTFGYAVVRQIEEVLGGQTVVPSFPTQPEEANRGYDVSFLSHGVPLFIQFKRSEVMRRKSCREYKDKNTNFQPPIFRMHLHCSHKFRQHFLMQDLESKGSVAVYCTSAVEDKNALDAHYSDGKTFDASTFFRPLEINLPSLDVSHHVSFCRGSTRAWVYSSEGAPFSRDTVTFDDVLARLRTRRDVPVQAQIELLRELVDQFDRLGAEEMADRQRAKRDYQHLRALPPSDEYEDRALIAASTPVAIESPDAREARRKRTRGIESVVKRAAIEAFFEADAMLVSVSRKALA